MTYKVLKSVVTGLLTGDNRLPADADVLMGLLSYALTTVATKADSLHLMTLSTEEDILRLAQGDYLIRRPLLPLDDTSELDIDEELGFAVARLMTSMLSKEKGGIHVQAADRIILDYNAKVYEITEQMQQEAAFAGVPSDGSDNYAHTYDDTEWTL